MINPEAGTITAGGLAFLRDLTHPARFYYYPVAPHLAIDPDGRPDFSLTLYRSLEEGKSGAYLILGIDLRPDQAALKAARPEVQKSVPVDMAAILEQLPCLHGELRLAMISQDNSQPQQILALATSLWAGQERARHCERKCRLNYRPSPAPKPRQQKKGGQYVAGPSFQQD